MFSCSLSTPQIGCIQPLHILCRSFLEGWEAGAGDPKKNHLSSQFPRGLRLTSCAKNGGGEGHRGKPLPGGTAVQRWRLKPGVFVAVALASAAREPCGGRVKKSSLLPSQKIELRIVGVLKSHLLESV